MTVSKTEYYPVKDFDPEIVSLKDFPKIRAKWTGEFRKPKKGEFYLSGAIIEAYQARENLSEKYHIAKLFLVHTKMVEQVIEIKDIGG